jgi:hypothetical protein
MLARVSHASPRLQLLYRITDALASGQKRKKAFP